MRPQLPPEFEAALVDATANQKFRFRDGAMYERGPKGNAVRLNKDHRSKKDRMRARRLLKQK